MDNIPLLTKEDFLETNQKGINSDGEANQSAAILESPLSNTNLATFLFNLYLSQDEEEE